MITALSPARKPDAAEEADYSAYMHKMQARFNALTAEPGVRLFTTDIPDLFATYLGAFSVGDKQYHHCNACRRFINQYGGIVVIDEEGAATSPIWSEEDAPEMYRKSVGAMLREIGRAKVDGVFYTSDKVWGLPRTGEWTHFAIKPASALLHTSRVQTPGQLRAEKSEDRGMLLRALADFDSASIATAVTLLKTDALYRSEKVLGVAEWLAGLHESQAKAKGPKRVNRIWRAVAMAPAGFCHVRSSMIGTLLIDLAAGLPFEDVKRKFAAKMHPLAYQRPQAAPAAGAIAAAEKLVEQLGIAESLPRRFARLDEVQALWKPNPPTPPEGSGGVFGHLAPKGKAPSRAAMTIAGGVITWEKFLRTVLPTADDIQFLARSGTDSFTSLVTAVNGDAPPILQWDSVAQRNPVSWYFWNGGATASSYGLTPGAWHKVNAVALKPSMWNGGFEHQGKGVMFVIEGAKDSRTPTACLFPEILKSELHGARAVIEAYSNGANMQGEDQASAAGVMYQGTEQWNLTLRVTAAGQVIEYKIDRFD